MEKLIEVPKGEDYNPGIQVKKALKSGTAKTAKDIVENML